MRIHDDIRNDSRVGEWHINSIGNDADHTLLAVAGGELVTDFGNAGLAGLYFDELIAGLDFADHDFVDVAGVGKAIALGLRDHCTCTVGCTAIVRQPRRLRVLGDIFVDVDITLVNPLTHAGDAVIVEEGVLADRVTRFYIDVRASDGVFTAAGVEFERDRVLA